MRVFCDNCGNELENNSIFCDECGKKFDNRESTINIILILSNFLKLCKSKVKNNRNIIGSSVLIIFLFLFLFLFLYLSYNKTQNTIKELQESQNKLNNITASTTEELRLQKIELAKKELEISKLETNIKNSSIVTINNNSTNNILSSISPSIVKIFCSADYSGDEIQSGSGVLYKTSTSNLPTYFVETNLHVTQPDDNSSPLCIFALYPDYKNPQNYLLYEVSDYKTYKYGADFIYLIPKITSGENSGTLADLAKYAKNKTSNTYCASSNIGEHISILGYPGVGGSSLTVTDGIVSGFEYYGGFRYIKTSAKIEHGSSGGVAIKDSGCVLGIPTYVETGTAESIGRILDLGTLFDN